MAEVTITVNQKVVSKASSFSSSFDEEKMLLQCPYAQKTFP